MRRLFGVLLAGAILTMPALSPKSSVVQAQAQKLTFDADAVVWMVTVKPDKTADFEAVMAALKDALSKSSNADAKAQAAGWKVVRSGRPQPDGTIVYAHLINPVVKGADYGVMANIYAAVPDPAEQKVLYDKYAGSFGANLMQVPLNNVLDFSK
jgi:hypothetical protein